MTESTKRYLRCDNCMKLMGFIYTEKQMSNDVELICYECDSK